MKREVFYPARKATLEHDTEVAKAICQGCPVTDICLQLALDGEKHTPTLRYGIFGGKTPDERKHL